MSLKVMSDLQPLKYISFTNERVDQIQLDYTFIFIYLEKASIHLHIKLSMHYNASLSL